MPYSIILDEKFSKKFAAKMNETILKQKRQHFLIVSIVESKISAFPRHFQNLIKRNKIL